MAAIPFIDKVGFVAKRQGSASSLALAIGTNEGASRTGFYGDLTAGAEKLGVVVNGVEVGAFSSAVDLPGIRIDSALQVGDYAGTAPAAGMIRWTGVNFEGYNGTAWIQLDAVTPPGGSDTHVQFNDGGAFGGDAGFTFNKTTGLVTITRNAVAPVAPPTGVLLEIQAADSAIGRVNIDTYGTGVYASFTGRSARGTAAAPSALQLNDEMTHISARGYGATGYSAAARAYISMFAAENWTDTAQGTRIGFYTTAPGGIVTAEAMRIWGDGGVQVGGTYAVSPGVGAVSAIGTVTAHAATFPIQLFHDPAKGASIIGANNTYSGGPAVGPTIIGHANTAFNVPGTAQLVVGRALATGDGGNSNIVMMGIGTNMGIVCSNVIALVNGGTINNSSQDAVIVGRPNSTGARCVLVGRVASGATNSVAIGWTSLASGSNSVALGHTANATFTNSVAIGYQSATTKSNQIILGAAANHTEVFIPAATLATSTTSAALVVTGGIATGDGLWVGGTLTFAGSTSGSAGIRAAAVAGTPATLILPTTSGTAGQALTTDGAGNLSWVSYQLALGYTPENVANKGVANGYASLDAGGKVPVGQLPSIALTDTFVVGSQAAMLALTAQTGDVAVRTDTNETYILQAEPATTLANWVLLLFPSTFGGSLAQDQIAYGSAVNTIASSSALTFNPVAGMALAPTVSTSGSPTAFSVTGAAHTTLTNGELRDVNLALARAVQINGGSYTNQRAVYIGNPTYNYTSATTITNAATLSIQGAPVPGTNATFTNALALDIESGLLRVAASTTSTAGFRIPHGATPTSPVNGDIWTTTAGVYARIAGSTVGPFGTVTGTGTATHVAFWSGPSDLTSDSSFTFNNTTKIVGARYIQFDISPAAPVDVEGLVYWSAQDHTLNIVPDVSGAVMQVGQELWARGRNNTGTTITNGTAIYFNGAQGNRPTIDRADADQANSLHTIAVVTADIADNDEGFATVHGIVRGIDTSLWTAGDMLWLDTTAGVITNTAPAKPNRQVRIGYALNSTNNGAIYVDVQSVPMLGDLSSVTLSGEVSGDVLQYNGTLWVNSTLAAAGIVSGTGTATHVAYWTGANTLGSDTGFTWDSSNNRLGISDSATTFAPLATFHASKNTTVGFRGDTYTNTATNGAAFLTYRARGTAAAPSAVQAGDLLGVFGMRGYGATGFSAASRANVSSSAAENWTDSAQGTYLSFSTTPIGGTATTEGVRLWDNGCLLIGTPDTAGRAATQLEIRASSPTFYINNTGGGSNAKLWRIRALTSTLEFETRNDADSSGEVWLRVNKTPPGSGVSSVEFTHNTITRFLFNSAATSNTTGTATFGGGISTGNASWLQVSSGTVLTLNIQSGGAPTGDTSILVLREGASPGAGNSRGLLETFVARVGGSDYTLGNIGFRTGPSWTTNTAATRDSVFVLQTRVDDVVGDRILVTETGLTRIPDSLSIGSTSYSVAALNIGNSGAPFYALRNNTLGGGIRMELANAKPVIYFMNASGTNLCKLGITAQSVANGENLVLGLGPGAPVATDLGIIIAGTTGNVLVTSTTAATTTTSAAFVVTGGVGIGGASYTAGIANFGTVGGTVGTLTLVGSTSGSATIKVAAAAGSPADLTLPTTSGTSGQVLATDGAGLLSWVTAGTIGGSVANTQIAYGSGANTLTSSANFTRGSVGDVTNSTVATVGSALLRGLTQSTQYTAATTTVNNIYASLTASTAGTSTVATNLEVVTTIQHTSGTTSTAAGIYNTFVANTGGTVSEAYGLYSRARLDAGTVSAVYGVYAAAEQNGATVANMYGMYVVTSGTVGSLKYGIYQTNVGTAATNVFESSTSILSSAVSTSPSNGALVVTGGVGIGSALNVGGSVNVTGSLVSGAFDFNTVTATRAVASPTGTQIGYLATLSWDTQTTNSGNMTGFRADMDITGSNSAVSGSTSWNGARLEVTNARTAGTIGTIYGLTTQVEGTGNGGTTNSIYGATLFAGSSAGHTSTWINGLYVDVNVNGNSTSQYGIYVYTRGSGTVTNKFGIYQDGPTFQNYFSGGMWTDSFIRQKIATTAVTATLARTVSAVKQTAGGITTSLWATPQTGDTVMIRNAGGGANNTVSGNGNNIDGAATLTLADGESAYLVFDGSEWTVF